MTGFWPSVAVSFQDESEREFFEARIRPILIEHCYECHNSHQSREGGLALDFRGGLLAGGDGGPVIDPVQPAASRLLRSLRHELEGLEMPLGRPPLPATVIQDFTRWIETGAIDPRETPPAESDLAAQLAWPEVRQRRQQSWAFQPIIRPPVPSQPGTSHPIDAFIRDAWERQPLRPAERAPADVLVRRLYLTLLGLPPTAAEARTWTTRLGGDDPVVRNQHYAALVDELLASPHFGERWARHWMDWIRYAESHGSEGDPPLVNAHHYRDYLIRSLNQDIPYDQLIREHMAGDLLPNPRINRELGLNESAIATAHWRMVFHGFAPTDPLDEQVRFIDDQINVLSKAFLGLTISCARCHDHKFDPIGQDDYYALFGILRSNRAARHSVSVDTELPRKLERVEELKRDLRHALVQDWLADRVGFQQRLADWVRSPQTRASPVEGWGFLAQAIAATERGEPLESLWNAQRDTWSARQIFLTARGVSPLAIDPLKAVGQESAAAGNPITTWFDRHGSRAERLGAGEFSVAQEGPQTLSGIYPGGHYSDLRSTKLPAVLTSDDLAIGDGEALWIRVIGDGQSSVRYVVRDYPRDGTVYPVNRLNGGGWRWQHYDVSYWAGDLLHVELAHAQDAPLLVAPQDRSWFGLREAWRLPKGTRPPDFGDEGWLALQALGTSSSNESIAVQPEPNLAGLEVPAGLESLLAAYESATYLAVEAWQRGDLSDAQAILLNGAVQLGLLPNDPALLTRSAPVLAAYRHWEREIQSPIRVPGLREATPRDQALFVRGDHRQPADLIPRRFLSMIDETAYPTDRTGRLDLADDLLRPDNPLTRRVIVNRLWHHVFGHGLVATPDNFGKLGAEPTHPELLDWLADEFSSNWQWSLKRTIRALVLSEVWQQGSTIDPDLREQDPQNRLFAYFGLRRLEAEAIRDTLLQSTGLLERRLFGAPSAEADHRRRAIYSAVNRNSLDPFLRGFDFPEPSTSIGRRDATSVPAQSLTLLNAPLVQVAAEQLAVQLQRDMPDATETQRVQELFWRCFGREATPTELAAATAFLTNTRVAIERLAKEKLALAGEEGQLLTQIEALTEPIERQWQADRKRDDSIARQPGATALASWNFRLGLQDQIGQADVRLVGSARLERQALVVDGQGYALAGPLNQGLRAKTLEAWVQLDDLTQRGGGVLSVQTSDGQRFDAIVYAERDPGQWLAGSEFFRRTQSWSGDLETQANQEPTHIAIVYDPAGWIRGYRNGQPYGEPYRTALPEAFEANQTVVSLGLRHLPSGGNRGLSGRIYQARIYDRALTAAEIAASHRGGLGTPTPREMVARLSETDREKWEQLQADLHVVRTRLETLQREAPHDGTRDSERTAWSELVHAVLLSFELISVR